MSVIAIGIYGFCAVVGAMAFAAYHVGKRIAAPKVPMQWGFNGQPTWYAPKVVALWAPIFVTMFGVPLFLVSIDSGFPPPRADRSAVGLIIFAVVMGGTYGAYLFAVVRWTSRQPS
jgi:hypothetical protein